MKILHILLTNPPPDVRVEGELKTLKEAGYETHLLTVKRPGVSQDVKLEGIEIARLSPIFYGVKLYPILFFLLLPILVAYRLKGIKILHVHDLIHAVPVIIWGRLLGFKVIADIHEDYVSSLEYGLQFTRNPAIKLIRSVYAKTFSLFENVLTFSHYIISISESEASRLWKIKPRNGVIIPNVMTIPLIERTRKLSRRKPNTQAPKIMYVGGFSYHRGLMTLIDAMPQVKTAYPNSILWLVGDGPANEDIRHRVKMLGLELEVNFTGWVDFDKAMEFMNDCDIFVIPYARSAQTDKSSPHKLFQAMYLEKPILVSDCPSLKEYVLEARCGCCFKAGDSRDLANVITMMLKEEERLQSWGENGILYLNNKYRWATYEEKLLGIYRDLTKGK